ncbi:MAG: MOSC domain-containing protein [Pseudomonadota bacterium]
MTTSLEALRQQFPLPGNVEWIGVRPARELPMSVREQAVLNKSGMAGDRFNAKRNDTRTVTLIQAEHLVALASLLRRERIDPAELRRNIVVSGINLLALKGQCFKVGAAVLEMTGLCHPCSKMERRLGPGAYNAMRGHGGITARVITAGTIALGDEVLVSR